jgi:hypothetical protein
MGEHFDAAVTIIPHPAGDPENVRLTLDKPAKANTLHPSANHEAAGLDRFFCGKLVVVRHFTTL